MGPEVEAVQQQHGMIPHLASPSSSMSHTPRSSAPGSRVSDCQESGTLSFGRKVVTSESFHRKAVLSTLWKSPSARQGDM